MQPLSDLQKTNGIIFCWDIHYSPLLYRRLLESLDGEKIEIQIVCQSQKIKVVIQQYLEDYQLEMANIKFLIYPFQSIWIRDYFPLPTADGHWLNFEYDKANKRPKDEKFAQWYAQEFELQLENIPLRMPGGNLIHNGQGIGFTTQLMAVHNHDRFKAIQCDLSALLNLELQFIDQMAHEYTGHIDMLLKFLEPDVLLTCALPLSHPDFERLQNNLEHINRVYPQLRLIPLTIAPESGSYEKLGNIFYSYVNSVLLNAKVLVPLFGEQTDVTAMSVYQDCFPDKEIHGIYCKNLFQLKGGLHCMVAQW